MLDKIDAELCNAVFQNYANRIELCCSFLEKI